MKCLQIEKSLHGPSIQMKLKIKASHFLPLIPSQKEKELKTVTAQHFSEA